MKLIDRKIAIWESNKYIDLLHQDNIDGISENWPLESCRRCNIIDDLCNSWYNEKDVNKRDLLIDELSNHLISAYKLLLMRESFGFDIQQFPTDKKTESVTEMASYLYNSNYNEDELSKLKNIDSEINNTRIDTARWCSVCGARKPDIIP